MEVVGKVKKIFETQEISEKFKKRDIVITTQEQYPQDILIQFTQNKTALLDEFIEGHDVVVGVNLRGREWINPQGEAKYFNTIEGWRIEKSSNTDYGSETPVQPKTNDKLSGMVSESPYSISDDDDDLPF